jgi:hypothetical protein
MITDMPPLTQELLDLLRGSLPMPGSDPGIAEAGQEVGPARW